MFRFVKPARAITPMIPNIPQLFWLFPWPLYPDTGPGTEECVLSVWATAIVDVREIRKITQIRRHKKFFIQIHLSKHTFARYMPASRLKPNA
jgi:hypothetical protein